jgi:pSer/pThr/pTyr-binding forkhead associated (FHA) protein
MVCGRKGDVVIEDDPFVSESQLRLFFSGNRLAVEDVGGGNGVFTRLRSERELALGGELRLGRQRLLLEPMADVTPDEDGAIQWGSADPGHRFRLVQLIEGGFRGAAWLLHEGDNAIGREVGDIAFPSDGFVSGRHALIHVSFDRVVVRDLGSSNGTFLRLAAPAFVDNGDQFLTGRQLLRVEFS